MFVGDGHSFAGARDGTESWLRGAPGGDQALGGGRIFHGAGHQAGGVGGSEARRKVFGLPDSAGSTVAEFPAHRCVAGGGETRAPWIEIQHYGFAVDAGAGGAASGGYWGARWRGTEAAAAAGFWAAEIDCDCRGGGAADVSADCGF